MKSKATELLNKIGNNSGEDALSDILKSNEMLQVLVILKLKLLKADFNLSKLTFTDGERGIKFDLDIPDVPDLKDIKKET